MLGGKIWLCQVTAQKTTRKTAQKIISLIKNTPGITRTELAEQCGISEDGIKWQLGQLKKKNIIRRVGADKGGYWQIIAESED